MIKISGSTTFIKRTFPIIWFGFVAVLLLANLNKETTSFFSVLGPLVMGVFGFFLFKKIAWDLADEVYDCGDHLIFKKGRMEQRVPLAEVINVSHSNLTSPERITLTVRNEGSMGTEISFSPPTKVNPFSKSKIAAELILRIDEARR